MKLLRFCLVFLFSVLSVLPHLNALEKQTASVYHARRTALAAKLHGGAAILFAAPESQLDLMPYREDEDFYYLTGWNEPGRATDGTAEGARRHGGRESRAQLESLDAGG